MRLFYIYSRGCIKLNARTVLKLLETYVKLFEQGGIEDLGEMPRVPAKGRRSKENDEVEPDVDEIVDEIESEVEEPALNDLAEALEEVLGEDWEVSTDDEEDYVLKLKHGKDMVLIRFVVDDGEPLVVFKKGDSKVTLSLYPLLNVKVTAEVDIINELVKSREKLSDMVGQLKNFVGDIVEVPAEEEEEEVFAEEEEEETAEKEVRESALVVKRRMPSLKRLLEVRRRLRRLKEEEEKDEEASEYVVKKIADAEVKYTQVGQDFDEEGEIAKKALEKMQMADIAKKVSPGEGNNPDIVGYIVNPEPK